MTLSLAGLALGALHPGKAAWAAAVCSLTHSQLFLVLGQAASLPVPPPPQESSKGEPSQHPSCDWPQGAEVRLEAGDGKPWRGPGGRRVLARELVTGVSTAARPSKQKNT